MTLLISELFAQIDRNLELRRKLAEARLHAKELVLSELASRSKL